MIEDEKSIQNDIKNQENVLDGWLKTYEQVFDLAFFQRENIKNLPNGDIIQEAGRLLEKLKNDIDGFVRHINESTAKVRSEYQLLNSKWNEKQGQVRDELNEAIAQLPEQAGKSGQQLGSEYTDVIARLRNIENAKKAHETQGRILHRLRRERNALLEDYRDLAFSRYSSTVEHTKKANRQLQGKIRIAIKRKGNPGNLKRFLLGLSGVGESKIRWLDNARDNLDLIQWSKWIEENKPDAFLDAYKISGMTHGVAEKLCGLDLEQRLKLEEIELPGHRGH